MIEIKTFKPDKQSTRFEFIKRIILIVPIIVLAHFVLEFRNTLKQNPPPEQSLLIPNLVFIAVLLIWTLTSKIPIQFSLNFSGKQFVIEYITLLRKLNSINIDFALLDFTFKKTPSRATTKKWTLAIFENGKKKFSVETGDGGFSQQALEELVQQLEYAKKAAV